MGGESKAPPADKLLSPVSLFNAFVVKQAAVGQVFLLCPADIEPKYFPLLCSWAK